MKGPWIIDVKGKPGEPFEISVVRADNEEGIRSWGWFGPDKLLISHSGGPCRATVTPEVWRGLIDLAKSECARLHRKGE